MKYFITVATLAFIISLGLTPAAGAQSYDFNNHTQHKVDMTAGFNFTMPLGQKRINKVEDKARFGFRLGLTESYENRNRPTSNRRSVDILEAGFRLDGRPNLLLNGQDIQPTLFPKLSANDDNSDSTAPKTTDDQNNKASANNVLLGVGLAVGIAAGVTVIALNEFEDSLSDAFSFD